MVSKGLGEACLRIVTAWVLSGLSEPLWSGQSITWQDNLWSLVQKSLLGDDQLPVLARIGGD